MLLFAPFIDSRRIHGLVVAVVVAMAPSDSRQNAAESAGPSASAALEKFLARQVVAHQYSGSRQLEASGSGQKGWLHVRTDFSVTSGLLYEVTGEGGSGYIRSRVLRSLLNEEQRLIAYGRTSTVALSTENYHFSPAGLDESGLAVVTLQPQRKDRSLITGRMFLTPETGELVRVEGRLAKNPSFWVTRTNVVRSYRRINGVLMPVSLETTAQLRIFGSSALRMTYRYSEIDRQPVSDETSPLQVDRLISPLQEPAASR